MPDRPGATLPNGDFVPQMGELEPEALAWLNSVFREIPESAVMPIHGAPPQPLRRWIKDNAEGIRVQQRVRETAIAAVEKATRKQYRCVVTHA